MRKSLLLLRLLSYGWNSRAAPLSPTYGMLNALEGFCDDKTKNRRTSILLPMFVKLHIGDFGHIGNLLLFQLDCRIVLTTKIHHYFWAKCKPVLWVFWSIFLTSQIAQYFRQNRVLQNVVFYCLCSLTYLVIFGVFCKYRQFLVISTWLPQGFCASQIGVCFEVEKCYIFGPKNFQNGRSLNSMDPVAT